MQCAASKKPLSGAARKPRNTPDKKKLIELAESNPNLTLRQMGELLNCNNSTIHRTLERYGCRKADVDQYKEYRADVLAGLQDRLLAKITAQDIEKAGLRDKVVAFGILTDKERLERGQSTVNMATLWADASDEDITPTTTSSVDEAIIVIDPSPASE